MLNQTPKWLNDAETIAIFKSFGPTTKAFTAGMSECGKSTVGKFIQQLYPRVVVIDTNHEYDEPAITDLAQLLRFFELNQKQSKYRVVYRFKKNLSLDQRTKDFDLICRMVGAFGNIHLSIEEVHNFCSPHHITHHFSDLNTAGRHNNVSIHSSSQRYALVNGVVKSQAHHKFFGQADEINDIRAGSGLFIGCEDMIMQLEPRQFLHKHRNVISAIKTDPLYQILMRAA